jgi:hydroxypyruvate reductase
MLDKKDLRIRKDAKDIFLAAIKAADPNEAIKRSVSLIQKSDTSKIVIGRRSYQLSKYQNVYVVGAGKASAAMAQSLEDILGKWIRDGLICVKYGYGTSLHRMKVLEAGHPIPDRAGLEATAEIINLLNGLSERDFVIFLISGGASALLFQPCRGITLSEKQEFTQLLLSCGATIGEINTLRKHISEVKGGQLARIAYPADMVSLILSDVVGDRLDVIASGPTVADSSTFRDCMEILNKYKLASGIPSSILRHLEKGLRGEVAETPKPGDPIFSRHKAYIIGNNSAAIKAASLQAKSLGYRPLILSSFIQGETRLVALMHAAIVKEVIYSGNPVKKPACLISGGEATVTIRGGGKGGRNQEFVLASALEMADSEGFTVLSGGTDGTDGPTEAAGAIADHHTLGRAQALGLSAYSFLENNDSYHFFQALDDLLITGPTGTNVMDIRIILIV